MGYERFEIGSMDKACESTRARENQEQRNRRPGICQNVNIRWLWASRVGGGSWAANSFHPGQPEWRLLPYTLQITETETLCSDRRLTLHINQVLLNNGLGNLLTLDVICSRIDRLCKLVDAIQTHIRLGVN